MASSSDIDLAGTWQIAASADSSWETAVRPPADTSAWKTVILPDWSWTAKEQTEPFDSGPCVWARRTFTLTAQQAKGNAALSWEMIRWMTVAQVNGTIIGEHDHFGPGRLVVGKAGVLREGDNELLLKIRNWNSLPCGGAMNWPLLPTGAAIFGWSPRESGIIGDIGLDLFERAAIRSVMMMPDLADSSVTAFVRLYTAPSVKDSARITVVVKDAAGAEIGRTVRSVTAGKLSDTPIGIKVRLSRYDLWSPAKTVMTQAVISLAAGPETRERSVSFGMRSFEARDGHFFLNGKPYTILGSNTIAPWLNPKLYRNPGNAFKKQVVDVPQGMNAAVLRTHTLPPLGWAADVCDSTGMLLLAESPFTYNYQNIGFSKAEGDRYHGTGKRMTLAWMEELANHPSIVMWVSTNEAPPAVGQFDQTAWDLGDMIPAMKQLDPSRPVLRAGEESPDVQDMHCYDGYWGGAAGDYDENVAWRAASRDGNRPVMNSEYIENLNKERIRRWLGLDQENDEARMFYAMIGMKQTETLRRLGFDGALPYGIYAWTHGSWRPYAPTPMYAALKNALSPLAVSLDLDSRNFTAGDTVTAGVWLINDRNDTVSVQLSCHVCAENPDFFPASPAMTSARAVFTRDFKLPPRSNRQVSVPFTLPKQPGVRWLAAALAPAGSQAVISQREIAVCPAAKTPAPVMKRTYRVIGADDSAMAWFRMRGIKTLSGIPYGRWLPDADMLIVWEGVAYTKRNLHITETINAFLKAGKRVLMMQQHGWQPVDWHFGAPGLPEGPNPSYVVAPGRCGLALREKAAGDDALWNGIDRTGIMWWNGLNNAVCRDVISALPSLGGQPDNAASKAEVMARSGDGGTVLARIAYGKSELLVTQLLLAQRLSKRSPVYDPMAEKVMLNLLSY